MMTYLIIILTLLVSLLLIRAAKKNRDKGESNLSVFEHPSTFKKPDIEMVSKTLDKVEKTDRVFKLKIPNKKTD
jgi:hypothetical protein